MLLTCKFWVLASQYLDLGVYCLVICNVILSEKCFNEFIYREGDKMIPSVEKKIAELETGLLHLLQNIEIPDITLPVHPVVAALIKKSAEEGVKPKATEVGDKVEDATFLNALQGGVNRWVREIQKVCVDIQKFNIFLLEI